MTTINTRDLSTAATSRVRRVPGEPGIWLFVLLDSLIFVEMFVLYTYFRADGGQKFLDAQDGMAPAFGLTYTVLLLTSSWLVVGAVHSARMGDQVQADRLLRWGMVLGLAFVALKFVEYADKFASGHSPVTNDFLMFYFVMTFVHLLHVTAGLIALQYARRQVRQASGIAPGASTADSIRAVEVSAIYWHMVDLLWIVLFALFYLKG